MCIRDRPYIMRICRILGEPKTFAAAIQMIPQALSASKPRLLACYLLARFGLKRGVLSTLVTLPNAKVSALLTGYFSERIEDAAARGRVLHCLHDRGLIASLPRRIDATKDTR